MATITLTVPDADLPDLVLALSQDWQAQVPDPNYQLTVAGPGGTQVPNPQPQGLVPNPVRRPDWARRNLAVTLASMLGAYRQAAHAQAFQAPATNIVAT